MDKVYKSKMALKCPADSKINSEAETSSSSETFNNFVRRLVKSEVKIVFKGLSEEGIQAGRKDIDLTIKKITKKVVLGDKGRHRMDPGSEDKIKAFVKSYLIQKFVHHKR